LCAIVKVIIMCYLWQCYIKVLAASQSGFLVGNRLSLADVGLLESLLMTVDYFGDETFQGHPHLKVSGDRCAVVVCSDSLFLLLFRISLQWRSTLATGVTGPSKSWLGPQIMAWPPNLVVLLTNCAQLILRIISKLDATCWQILRLKCTKFDLCLGSAPDPRAHSAPPDALAVFKGTCF